VGRVCGTAAVSLLFRGVLEHRSLLAGWWLSTSELPGEAVVKWGLPEPENLHVVGTASGYSYVSK